jgi:hypothetical protein
MNFVYNGAAHTLTLKFELNVSLCMCLHTLDDDPTEILILSRVLFNFFIPHSYLHFISEICMIALIQICICLIPRHFIQHCPSKNNPHNMAIWIKFDENSPYKTYK